MSVLMREINASWPKFRIFSILYHSQPSDFRNGYRASGIGDGACSHSLKRTNYMHLFQTPQSQCQLEIDHGGSSYTTEISKYYKMLFFPVQYIPAYHCCKPKKTGHSIHQNESRIVNWTARTIYSIRGQHANI